MLKVGDKVVLRRGLIVDHKYDGITFSEAMAFTEPRVINYISEHSKCCRFTRDGYYYSQYMLKKVKA